MSKPTIAILGPQNCGKTKLAEYLNDHAEYHGCVVEYEGLTESLRELRLWHWNECLALRKDAMVIATRGDIGNSVTWNKQANMHLKFVQTLNSFFSEVGDTAERDAERIKL